MSHSFRCHRVGSCPEATRVRSSLDRGLREGCQPGGAPSTVQAAPSVAGRSVPQRRWVWSLGLGLLVAVTGCKSHVDQATAFRAHWQRGNVELANSEVAKRVRQNAEGRDGVIWLLEQAQALRVAGKFAESNEAFEHAERRMAEYEERGKIRVTTEAMAAFTTPANLPYEGQGYDKILAATYRALNCLALAQPDGARTALFKAYQYQQDAVAVNARRIERAQEDARSHASKDAIAKTTADPKFQTSIQGLFDSTARMQPYSDYVVPFSVWLDGVYFLHRAQDASDLERSKKSFERVLVFCPSNSAARVDLANCERCLNGEKSEPTTYLVVEAGSAPIREQIRIDVPILLTDVSYVGTAWPQLKSLPGPGALTVSTGAGDVEVELVSSMDAVVARDFENEKPQIITRTVISTLTKGTAAYFINAAAGQQGDIAGLVARLGTAAYQFSVNIADTRTWSSLPKEFRVARLATPINRRISLRWRGGSPVEIPVPEGDVNLIHVLAVNEQTPLRVSSLRLR